jgi:hypothetical protein
MSVINELLQGKGEYSTRIVLTEEVINDLLSRNTNNRKIRKNVEILERDLKTNGWIDYAPMAVDIEGNLADGQHRLIALKRAGIFNAEVTLHLNVSKKVKMRIDRGNSRTIMNVLQLNGIELPNIAVAIMNLDLRMNHEYLVMKYHKVEPHMIEKHYSDKWKNIFEEMPRLLTARFNFGGKLYGIPAGGLCAIAQYGVKTSFDNANDFLEGTLNGDSENETPQKAYREYIIANQGSEAGAMAQQSLYRKTVYCLRTHNKRENIKRIYEVKEWGF